MDDEQWPVIIDSGRIVLRPLRLRDFSAWQEVRLRNRDWIKKWEPTGNPDWTARHTFRSFRRLHADLRAAARQDRSVPLVLTVDGALAGQVNLGPISRGAMQSADIGYWIDKRHAGQGLVPYAVALVVRHAFTNCRIHRVHAAVQPQNTASVRVVEKLGFRCEGRYARYLDIDGGWADHLGYAITTEDDLSALREVLARNPLDG